MTMSAGAPSTARIPNQRGMYLFRIRVVCCSVSIESVTEVMCVSSGVSR